MNARRDVLARLVASLFLILHSYSEFKIFNISHFSPLPIGLITWLYYFLFPALSANIASKHLLPVLENETLSN
jgi:hypothetical protein